MKRVIALSIALLVTCASLAAAQTAPSTKPLADVAKKEEERRNQTKKPTKVYTNSDLKPEPSKPVAAPPSVVAATAAGNARPGNATPGNATPGAPAAVVEVKDQAYWQSRIKTARDQVQRLQIFADSLQSRINALYTDFVNRDDPAQRSKIEADRKTALAELERVKKELDEATKSITAIEDEARRAGVPPGWLRPPV
jgi:hypothetical protein